MGLRRFHQVEEGVLITLPDASQIKITVKNIRGQRGHMNADLEVRVGDSCKILLIDENSKESYIYKDIKIGLCSSTNWTLDTGKVGVHYSAPLDYIIKDFYKRN